MNYTPPSNVQPETQSRITHRLEPLVSNAVNMYCAKGFVKTVDTAPHAAAEEVVSGKTYTFPQLVYLSESLYATENQLLDRTVIRENLIEKATEANQSAEPHPYDVAEQLLIQTLAALLKGRYIKSPDDEAQCHERAKPINGPPDTDPTDLLFHIYRTVIQPALGDDSHTDPSSIIESAWDELGKATQDWSWTSQAFVIEYLLSHEGVQFYLEDEQLKYADTVDDIIHELLRGSLQSYLDTALVDT